MSDNVYRVLMGDNAPFGGMANISYYDRILRGRIVKVHYNIYSKSSKENEELVFNQQSYRSVDIDWLEGKPYTSEKVHIPELVSFLGYGLNYLPSVNDIVIAGFDSSNEPHVISIVARCSSYEHGAKTSDINSPISLNKYGDPYIDDTLPDDIRPTPIRYIKPGEISLTSLNNNSELYFDEYGTAKLISRIPNLTSTGDETTGKIYTNGQQCGDRLWEISTGQDILDEGTKEIKQSSFGNNIQFQILGHQNDCKVDFDKEGNIEIHNKGNDVTLDVEGNFKVKTSTGNIITLTNGIIKIEDSNGNSMIMNNAGIKLADSKGNSIVTNSAGIQFGDAANFSAVLGESLATLLTSMIAIFNSHTHMYSPGGGTPTSTAPSEIPMTYADILSKTIKLKQ